MPVREGGRLWLSILVLFALTAALAFHMRAAFPWPYPPLTRLVFDVDSEFADRTSYDTPLGGEGGFRDFAGLLLGMRRLTADVAWIGILQYYGAHEHAAGEEEHGHAKFGAGHYSALKKMTLRIMRLDPTASYAVLYGAGSLAFNLDRPDEGLDLLKEAIQADPTYWRYRLYVGAILYKQQGKFDEMLGLLEDATRYPDCPTMIKTILANNYKERKEYAKALRVWINVLDDEKTDAWYRRQAQLEIADLRKRLGI